MAADQEQANRGQGEERGQQPGAQGRHQVRGGAEGVADAATVWISGGPCASSFLRR